MSKFTPEMKEKIVALMVKHGRTIVCGKETTLKDLYKMKLIDRLSLFNQMYTKIDTKFDHKNVSVNNFDECLKAYISIT